MVLLAVFASAPASASGIIGAGHTERGWIIIEGLAPTTPGARGALLFHAPADVPPGAVVRAQALPSMPDHVAAWGERLVMVYEPERPGEMRSVRMVSVIANPASGVYVYRPSDRQEALPSLTGEGEFAGIVETRSGPVAMLLRGGAPSLLRLERGEWVDLDAPPVVGEAGARRWRLLPLGDGFGLLEDGAEDQARLWTPGAAGSGSAGDAEWRQSATALRADDGAVISAGGGLVAVNRLPSGEVQLDLVRETRRHELARVAGAPGAPGKYAALAIGDAVGLAWIDPANGDRLHLAVVSAITGRLLHTGPTLREPLLHTQDIQLLALLLGAVMLTVLIFVLKPEAATKAAIQLPQGTALAQPGRRLAAGLIDMAPGFVIASRVWEMSIGEVVSLPWRVAGPSGLWPVITVLAIYFVHSAASEWLFGKTLGKGLVGCRTISVTGEKPTLWQSASRNAVKALAPPVTLLALVDLRRRHAGDIVSGTVVISRVDADEGAGAPDQPADDDRRDGG